MVDLHVNPQAKAPQIPSWVKWAGTAALGTFVSWHVSRMLERYAAMKAQDFQYPHTPTAEKP